MMPAAITAARTDAVRLQVGPRPSRPGVTVSGAVRSAPRVQSGGNGHDQYTASETAARKPSRTASPSERASNHPMSRTYPSSLTKFATEPIVTYIIAPTSVIAVTR